jgi:glycogen operon protein
LISWLDWTLIDKNEDYHKYVKRLIAFRKKHPVLMASDYSFGENGTGYPELSFHGTKAWSINENEPALCFGYMFAEDGKKYGTGKDAFIYVAVNAYWEEQSFELPKLPDEFSWYLVCESYGYCSAEGKENKASDQSSIVLGPRTTAILIGKM